MISPAITLVEPCCKVYLHTAHRIEMVTLGLTLVTVICPGWRP